MATFTTLSQLNTVAQAICTKADARFRKLSDAIAEADLATALATKINGKADSSDLTTLSGKVTTLIGNVSGDDAKSVRAISAEEVAKVVAGAPTSFDTLKEIADWIQNDTTGAAKMANDITALQTKTELGTYTPEGGSPTQYASVKAYVEAYVAEQQSSAALSAGNGIDITSNVVSAVVDSNNANGLSVGASGLALAAATTSTPGAMSAADKVKLDGADVTAYTAGNGINVANHEVSAVVDSSNANGLSVGASGLALAAATTSTAGAMSAADKTKLDGLVEATSAEITTLVDGLWPTT